MILTFEVEDSYHDFLLKDFLRAKGCSASFLTKVKKHQGFFVNEKSIYANERVKTGMKIQIPMPPDEEGEKAEDLPLHIVYEDEHAMVIEKPRGMAMHPTSGIFKGTLANAFAGEMNRRGILRPFRAINRLDRNVTGLVLCAMNAYSAPLLAKSVQKKYFALVEGVPEQKIGIWQQPIARKEESLIQRCCTEDGKPSVTRYRVIKEMTNPSCSLLECILETGRTHQIRVHASHNGYPLLGDDLYGSAHLFTNQPALHCGEILFENPITKKKIVVTSCLPFSQYHAQFQEFAPLRD